MYESHLEHFEQGVTDIDLSTDGSVTLTFAVGTDENALAFATVDRDGTVSAAFGGTGITRSEL